MRRLQMKLLVLACQVLVQLLPSVAQCQEWALRSRLLAELSARPLQRELLALACRVLVHSWNLAEALQEIPSRSAVA